MICLHLFCPAIARACDFKLSSLTRCSLPRFLVIRFTSAFSPFNFQGIPLPSTETQYSSTQEGRTIRQLHSTQARHLVTESKNATKWGGIYENATNNFGARGLMAFSASSGIKENQLFLSTAMFYAAVIGVSVGLFGAVFLYIVLAAAVLQSKKDTTKRVYAEGVRVQGTCKSICCVVPRANPDDRRLFLKRLGFRCEGIFIRFSYYSLYAIDSTAMFQVYISLKSSDSVSSDHTPTNNGTQTPKTADGSVGGVTTLAVLLLLLVNAVVLGLSTWITKRGSYDRVTRALGILAQDRYTEGGLWWMVRN